MFATWLPQRGAIAPLHRLTTFVLLVAADLRWSDASVGPLLWKEGRVIVSSVDEPLESAVSCVFDDVERKTFLRFLRGQEGGINIRASHGTGPMAGSMEFCCFDPSSGAILPRQFACSLLKMLGVECDETFMGTVFATSTPQDLITSAEAEALNMLYARIVMPATSILPARLEVGIWQLSHAYNSTDWDDIIAGRGRRLVAAAMHLAKVLATASPVLSIEGALPTFSFSGNKAEIVVLGSESGTCSTPAEFFDAEGFGAGIKRATLYARALNDGEFVGGVPTGLGDGSVLLLRRSLTEQVLASISIGQNIHDVLADHHSAQVVAQVSRWAQGHGALLGLPSFVDAVSVKPEQQSTSDANGFDTARGVELEVLVLRGRDRLSEPLAPKLSRTRAEIKTVDSKVTSNLWPSFWSVVQLFGMSGLAVAAVWKFQLRFGQTRAERELARMVAIL